METGNKKVKVNLDRIGQCLESSVCPSLVRVLSDAHQADVISVSQRFRQIFMYKLAEDLWYNNPMHPERKRTSDITISLGAGSGDGSRPSFAGIFSWGMSRKQAAITIQVYLPFRL